MKKFLLFPLLTLTLYSCGSSSKEDNEGNDNTEEVSTEEITNEIEATITDNLKKVMKNPESLKIESIEIKKDTLPYYLCEKVLSQAKKTGEALDEFLYYKDKSSYWAEEKATTYINLELAKMELESVITSEQSLTKAEPVIAYIACVVSSGENSFGGTVSDRSIFAIDVLDPKKVLCRYDIDDDFLKCWGTIKYKENGNKHPFEKDRFGNYITDGLPFIEQFILGN